MLLIQRHGVAQVFLCVGNPAAVKAQKLLALRQALNFIKLFSARQHARMPRVLGLVFTDMLFFVHMALLSLCGSCQCTCETIPRYGYFS
jgi:hypothetical protein